MAKVKKPEKKAKGGSRIPNPIANVSTDTKKSVIGILLIGVSVVLFLAAFGSAGPAGNFFYHILDLLLGVGYYLIPSILLIVGLLFLLSREEKFFDY
jgi:hypothetical protein